MATTDYGLIFGGETRDAFGIGMYRAALAEHLPINCAVGAAFGAYNAALICAGNPKAADTFWNAGLADKLIALNNEIAGKSLDEWMTLDAPAFRRAYLRCVFREHKTLYEALSACIDETAVRRSPIRFGLATVNEKTLMPVAWMIETIPEGKLARTLMVSATIPVYRQDPEGFNYLENGLYERMPARLAFKQNAGIFLGSDLSEKGLAVKARKKGKDLTNVAHSQLDITTQRDAITLGELDTLKTLGYLQGEDYYLDPAASHTFFDALTRSLGRFSSDAKTAAAQRKLLGLSGDATQVDALTVMMRLLSQTKYQKAANKSLAFLEITAKCLGIPRLQKRYADDLILAILTAFETGNTPGRAKLFAAVKNAASPDDTSAAALPAETKLAAAMIFAIGETAAQMQHHPKQ